MSILSASIAKVKIGIISIEGLMDEKSDYAIAVSQIAGLFQLLPNNATRDIKALNSGNLVTTSGFAIKTVPIWLSLS